MLSPIRSIMMAAALAAGVSPFAPSHRGLRLPRRARKYPMPVCSPREEIEAWNRAVDRKKAERAHRRAMKRAGLELVPETTKLNIEPELIS